MLHTPLRFGTRWRRALPTFSRVVAGALCASALALTSLDAQSIPPRPDSLARDSLARAAVTDSILARLARTEADLALLRQQVATEASTQIRLRSRVRLDLHARLLTNAFFTTATSSSSEIPVFASAPGAIGGEYGSSAGREVGFSIRQSTMGASVSVDSLLGAMFTADLELDFYGNVTGEGTPLYPTPRVRTVRGFLRWPRTELMIGADTPLISDLDPMGVAAIAIPDFSTAGNLWNWLPQVRLTRELGVVHAGDRALHLALQGAVITPFSDDHRIDPTTGAEVAPRAARPSVEGRVRAQWGLEHDATSSQRIGDHGGEIGLGAHRGWMVANADSLTASWALSADARVGLSHGLELRGEAYRGRLLNGLGGGGIGQNFAPSTNSDDFGDPLTSTAGWLQLNAQLRPTMMAGMGCGTERVHNGAPARQRNTACATHLEWRPTSPLLFGLEYRGIATRGPAGRQRAGHVNLFFGIEL
ncbi:MAG: hypothetical protein ABMA00_10745, partial [Gemmatimonas sp.]